jgi:hypothetical protein
MKLLDIGLAYRLELKEKSFLDVMQKYSPLARGNVITPNSKSLIVGIGRPTLQ